MTPTQRETQKNEYEETLCMVCPYCSEVFSSEYIGTGTPDKSGGLKPIYTCSRFPDIEINTYRGYIPLCISKIPDLPMQVNFKRYIENSYLEHVYDT